MTPPYDPSNPSSPEARRAAFRLLFLCLLATGVGNNMLFAILPPLARELQVAEFWVGAIYTLSALLFMTMTPVWGALSDRRGRKPLIIFGLSAFAFSTLVFAGATWAGESGLAPPLMAIFAMALARALFGSLGSATNPSAQAYVADRTSREERTEALAGLTSAFGFGAALGPPLAAVLAGRVGVPAFMAIISVVVAGCAYAIWRHLPEKTPPSVKPRPVNPIEQFRYAGDPRVMPFAVYGALVWIVQSLSLSSIAFFLMDKLALNEDQGLDLSSIALFSGAMALIFAQLVVIPTLKASPRVLMIIGGLAAMIGGFMMIFADRYVSIVMGHLFLSFGFGLSRSGFVGGASVSVEPEEQGQAAGITTATAGLGFIIGPVGGLILYAVTGPNTPYLVAAILSAVAALFAWLHPGVRAAAQAISQKPDPEEPH